MSSQSTEAVVLHAFDYLESSRIIKLLTRDFGLRSEGRMSGFGLSPQQDLSHSSLALSSPFSSRI